MQEHHYTFWYPYRSATLHLAGTLQQIIDRSGRYQEAGATWLNAVLRGSIDLEGPQLFIEEVVPAFQN